MGDTPANLVTTTDVASATNDQSLPDVDEVIASSFIAEARYNLQKQSERRLSKKLRSQG